MSSVLALGWLLAATAAILLLLERREARRRAEGVVRACHELRQPLQAMLLFLGAPRQRGSELSTALAPELDRARRAAEELSGRAERRLGAPWHEPLDLAAAVRAQARLHDAVAAGRGRRVHVRVDDAPAVLPVDRGRIAQAVGNLIGNALEHGRGDVRVSVETTSAEVVVAVRDDGPGLPERPELLRRARGRHGRGLAIAREAAAEHGGGLVADGPAVKLVLPRPAAADPVAPARRAAGRVHAPVLR